MSDFKFFQIVDTSPALIQIRTGISRTDQNFTDILTYCHCTFAAQMILNT